MEKRPDSKVIKNVVKETKIQKSADKPSLTIKPPKKN